MVLIRAMVSAAILGFVEVGLEPSPPEPAECLTMPAEEGFGMHKEKSLFPPAHGPCEQYQEHSLGLDTRWALRLTAEDDQLLTEQRVFGNEFQTWCGPDW